MELISNPIVKIKMENFILNVIYGFFILYFPTLLYNCENYSKWYLNWC